MQINENIINLCNELKLPTTIEKYHNIASQASKENWTYSEFLNEILQTEVNQKLENSKKILTKFASFPAIKKLEEFDYNFTVGVNSKQINELASLEFVRKNENIIFLGQSGVGKTHLATALSYKAIQNRFKVKFITTADLLSNAISAKKNKKYDYFLKSVLNPSILIIDELGYFNMTKEESNHFFQIISKRYEKGSTIITSNLVFSKWQQVFGGDKIVTAAILDRILHHSHIINIQGESYRLKEHKEAKKIDLDLFKNNTKKDINLSIN
jgi:DNA replication protein DnaC